MADMEAPVNKNESCNYFVLRKKRYCRMTVRKGFQYCGEHQHLISTPNEELLQSHNTGLRVICPLDSKHTCYANKLDKHLKKCNSNKVNNDSYILKGVNSESGTAATMNENRALADVPVADIITVLNKINSLYKSFIEDNISESILNHEQLSSELSRNDYGANTRKHLLQNSSLLGHLHNSNMLKAETCFVEFGAGKGQLSYWISKATEDLTDASVLLVERQSLRHKLDNKLDKSNERVVRIKADIADLVLSEISLINRTKRVVGVAKHLCGDATDFALRCLVNGVDKGVNVLGLLVAFCCHHRCHWTEYVGKSFFSKNNLTKYEFDIICGVVSWATCGLGHSRTKRLLSEDKQTPISERDQTIGLTREEKETAGKKCKLLIDYGRLQYLQEMGFHGHLYYYVDQKVSLENVCILASK